MPERYERILFRYSSALERGDFETVADVLREAERDPALEAMLLELNDVYAAEPTGRSNHRNPKELTMIAPLYEKRAPERVRTYNLPMVAALAVVALLGVLLATRISPPTQWNTAQNGSPEPNVLQVDPTTCAQGVPLTLKLYSRPALDARVIYEYNSVLYLDQRVLTQSDAAEVDGETWYFVTISGGFQDVQGWIKAEEFNRNVRCAPLVNPEILTRAIREGMLTSTPTLTATPAPFVENFDVTATALIVEASALPPTVVPPEMMDVMTATPVPFDGSMPTVVPADVQGLATFTATPAPFDGSMPTVVPPDMQGLTTFTPTPALFDGSMPTVVPTSTPFPLNGDVLPTEGNANAYGFPIYTVQEGDTLGSILRQFNLGVESLDELLFINELPDETVELPAVLLIPINLAAGLPLCKRVTDAPLDVHTGPNSDTALSTTLPAYTVFEEGARVTQADNRTWRQIRARLRNGTIIAGWVTLETTFYVGECRVPIGEVFTASQFITTTPTPLPTALPPTATPTPAQ